MQKKRRIYKRGQCVEYVERGQPYVACFSSMAAARVYRRVSNQYRALAIRKGKISKAWLR